MSTEAYRLGDDPEAWFLGIWAAAIAVWMAWAMLL
jgi:hypothetical protein